MSVRAERGNVLTSRSQDCRGIERGKGNFGVEQNVLVVSGTVGTKLQGCSTDARKSWLML